MFNTFLIRITFVYIFIYFFPYHPDAFEGFVIWAARNIFAYRDRISTIDLGSGDRVLDYFYIATTLLIAVVAGSVWAILERKKYPERNPFVLKWMLWYLRMSLGAVMITYGIIKVFPAQFPAPSLTRMMGTFGNTSPSRLLWLFIGSSPVYGLFAGLVELVGGIMLLLPYVWFVGALLALGAMANVFWLNVSYDVAVKTFSLSLFLASMIIVCSQGKPLFDFLFKGKAVKLELVPVLFKSKLLNRLLLGFQVLLLSYYLVTNYQGAQKRLQPKAEVPMQGIWYVVDAKGVEMFPWTHLIFDTPELLAVKLRDGSIERIKIEELNSKILKLRKKAEDWKVIFNIDAISAGHLTLRGAWDGHPLELNLEKVDESKFRMKSIGFTFTSEVPFND